MANRTHKHTRLNRYTRSTSKRKKGFSPYWFILFAALLAIIAALILGNFLGKMVEDAPKDDQNSGSQIPPASLLDASQIQGFSVTLKGINDNTAYNVKMQVPSGATAVSLSLFNENGEPYYFSAVADSFGNKCGELTLSRVFEGLSTEQGLLYSSIILPASKALANTDKARQAVLNAYEGAIIEELYSQGARDVIITLSDETEIGEEFFERLTTYVATVRSLSPDLRVGLSLEPTYYTNVELAADVERLSKICDFLAIDLTEISDLTELESALSNASINILRRSLRLLLSYNNTKYADSLIEMLGRYSMNNWQFAK